jgi:hypothetical protein
MSSRLLTAVVVAALLSLSGCQNPGTPPGTDELSAPSIRQDPDLAEVTSIDRFSDQAGTFFRRSENPNLPGPDQPITLDEAPFLISAFAPDGGRVEVYHLDARPTNPANLYIFFRADGSPLDDQLYVFDALPGEAGYNDFCAIQRVTVPDGYVSNSITSRADLEARRGEGFKIESTGKILNMPVVPAGSVAERSIGQSQALLLRGWCRHKVLYYFAFDEVQADPQGLVPTAPMYSFVSVNGLPHRGGFRTMSEAGDTRNVLSAMPGQPGFSPLWALQRLVQEDFTSVSSLADVKGLGSQPIAYGSTINAVVVK